MARERTSQGSAPESVISIVGPGMKVVGDCETDGTLRIEGAVQGTVRAAKAVVIGRDGLVIGDVITQDAVVSGRVEGSVTAESRLELQASCQIDGEVYTPRLQLEEGAVLNGSVNMKQSNENRAPGSQNSDSDSDSDEAEG
ncbi:MAG: polymer-forming cytoskeletal protein [Gemmatimonadota bacterium]